MRNRQRRAFIREPALNTMSLAPMLLLASPSGCDGSYSPDSLVNPPKGIALREYRVSPRRIDQRRGGRPSPNSSTFTPNFLAVRKCPSSCGRAKKIMMAKKTMPAMAMVSMEVPSPLLNGRCCCFQNGFRGRLERIIPSQFGNGKQSSFAPIIYQQPADAE